MDGAKLRLTSTSSTGRAGGLDKLGSIRFLHINKLLLVRLKLHLPKLASVRLRDDCRSYHICRTVRCGVRSNPEGYGTTGQVAGGPGPPNLGGAAARCV